MAVNGVKFYSWRPENTTGIQQKTIEIPLELIKETNTLTVEATKLLIRQETTCII